MAEITASMVKELRERTGAGMMDCKNALVEAGGDMAKAAEILQKKGQAKAVKAAGKVAAEGMIVDAVSPDAKHGVLVEVNCQTDFVARGEDFQKFARLVAQKALESGVKTAEELNEVKIDGKTVREMADELTARSGEKHVVRRMERYDVSGQGLVTTYIHHGSRLGVMVEVSGPDSASLKDFADDIALQIASMSPKYVAKEHVPPDVIAKQREIFAAQMANEDEEAQKAFEEFKARVEAEPGEVSDKVKEHLKNLEKKASAAKARPQAARDKILDGKVAKWLTEIVLLDQVSVKDSSKTIAQLVDEVSKQQGRVAIERFVRFEVGEGIEKGAVKDFATEVAEMAAASQRS